jgi:hypothetical protein
MDHPGRPMPRASQSFAVRTSQFAIVRLVEKADTNGRELLRRLMEMIGPR